MTALVGYVRYVSATSPAKWATGKFEYAVGSQHWIPSHKSQNMYTYTNMYIQIYIKQIYKTNIYINIYTKYVHKHSCNSFHRDSEAEMEFEGNRDSLKWDEWCPWRTQ